MRKFGRGKILPEKGDDQKVAKKNFTDKDRAELEEEIKEEEEP